MNMEQDHIFYPTQGQNNEMGVRENPPVLFSACDHLRCQPDSLLVSVEKMVLNLDLTSVSAEHLASLTSSVTGRIDIMNFFGCDLITILEIVTLCGELTLDISPI